MKQRERSKGFWIILALAVIIGFSAPLLPRLRRSDNQRGRRQISHCAAASASDAEFGDLSQSPRPELHPDEPAPAAAVVAKWRALEKQRKQKE
jgi:hypothetical protein